MISIAQNKRSLNLFKVFGREGLDCGLRANRCENGCDQVAVWCCENPCAGAVVFGCNLKGEHAVIISDGFVRLAMTNHAAVANRHLRYAPSAKRIG